MDEESILSAMVNNELVVRMQPKNVCIVRIQEVDVDLYEVARLLDTDATHEAIAKEVGVCIAAVEVVATHTFLRYLQGKGAPPCPEVERPDEEYTYVDDSDW